LSSDVVIWCCHLMLPSAIVIWCCHVLLSSAIIICCFHLMFSSGVSCILYFHQILWYELFCIMFRMSINVMLLFVSADTIPHDSNCEVENLVILSLWRMFKKEVGCTAP
jgi:hypothetical protein